MIASNRTNKTILFSLLAPGLGHVRAGRELEGLAFAGGTVAVGMLGTVAILASPRLAGPALVVSTCGWAAVWIAAAVHVARGGADANPPGPGERRAVRAYFSVLLGVLTLASVGMWAIAVRERVAEVFHVPSGSMAPAIRPGARVVVDKLAYRTGPVRRGDVVVFVNPNERAQLYVKRVVALPGDLVEMRGGDLSINGTALPHGEPTPQPDGARLVEETNAGARYRIRLAPENDGPPTSWSTRVPNGSCFLLGDNRQRSVDSRDVGPIPLADILGRVSRTF